MYREELKRKYRGTPPRSPPEVTAQGHWRRSIAKVTAGAHCDQCACETATVTAVVGVKMTIPKASISDNESEDYFPLFNISQINSHSPH